jgi:cell division protein FtsW (lipid II flippase)
MMLALSCAALSVAFGLVYLYAAGAPPRHLLINVGALAVGMVIAAVARNTRMWNSGAAGVTTIAVGVLLSAIAWCGAPVSGAARWIVVAGLSLQPSLILLPAAIVAFAGRRDVFSSLGLAIAGVALGAQPDRAMAGTLVSGLGVLWIARRREPAVAMALVVAVLGFVVACIGADMVPPAPYVEQVVESSFAIDPLVGLAVVAGLATMLVPAAIGLAQSRQRRAATREFDAFLVFSTAWLAIVVSAMAGNYPTPLVGYGSSAILGYCLSASALVPDSSKFRFDGEDRIRRA